jgi:hypothetical protein
MTGRTLLLVCLFAGLTACASVSPEVAAQMEQACTPERVAAGQSFCDWRVLNRSRQPNSFVGHYRSADRDFDGHLLIAEREGRLIMTMGGGSRSTQHQCYGDFEGAGGGDRIELAARPNEAFETPCVATLARTSNQREVSFSMNRSCYAICGVRVSADGVYRLSND